MRSHLCPDCGQLVKHERWAGHLAKHGRVVSEPHTRTVITDEEEEAVHG